jgi:predicted Zn finger-like uncharacterized protein
MRLVTSCPSCNTSFYVLPDQLTAHRGDVRCGNCEHVFNALDRLAEVLDNDPVNKVEPSLEEPSIAEESAPIDIQIIAESDVAGIQPTIAAPPESRDKSPQGAGALSQELPAISIPDYSNPPSASILSPTMMDDAARNNPAKTSSAPRKSTFAKSLIFLLVLILLVTGFMQAVYYLRSDIAARWPQFRPMLEQACEYVQCKVELPMNADLIVIDDSDLQEDVDREGLIHLYATLINTADHAQAYPLLELTLTDVNEKPLSRRLFKPEEYLPAGANIKRGVLSNEEINIKLSLTASGEDVAGYRLFVTY